MVGDILQPTHLLFVLVVALLVLGPKRLPEVGRALGDGIRDFKSAISGESDGRHEEASCLLTYAEPNPVEKNDFAHAEPEATEKAEFVPDGHGADGGHEFAHSAPESAEKPEFAYEGSEPADQRPEPPA
jgi:sec-independent protein translocase protein TatA